MVEVLTQDNRTSDYNISLISKPSHDISNKETTLGFEVNGNDYVIM